MTTSPVPSMTHAVQPHPVLPGPYTAVLDHLKNGWFVCDGRDRVGHVFPHIVADLAGSWHGRRVWQAAKTFDAQPDPLGARRLAFAHVCGCDPSEIRFEVVS